MQALAVVVAVLSSSTRQPYIVEQSSPVDVVVVLVVLSLTSFPYDVVLRQISAVCVWQSVGLVGSGIGPFVGILWRRYQLCHHVSGILSLRYFWPGRQGSLDVDRIWQFEWRRTTASVQVRSHENRSRSWTCLPLIPARRPIDPPAVDWELWPVKADLPTFSHKPLVPSERSPSI